MWIAVIPGFAGARAIVNRVREGVADGGALKFLFGRPVYGGLGGRSARRGGSGGILPLLRHSRSGVRWRKRGRKRGRCQRRLTQLG